MCGSRISFHIWNIIGIIKGFCKCLVRSQKPVCLLCLFLNLVLHQNSMLLLLLLLSGFSRLQLCATHRRQPTRLPRPWDSPGKNTGVGCHFLLQCIKVKSESEFAQSCPTPSDPMDCSLPGSSVHGIFQARVLEWVAIAFSMESLKNYFHQGDSDLNNLGWTIFTVMVPRSVASVLPRN